MVDGLVTVFPEPRGGFDATAGIAFDIIANAFYFLSSWSERAAGNTPQTRRLHASSVFARLGIPQDVVDRYLDRIVVGIDTLCKRIGSPGWPPLVWPQDREFALVLSHDVDFIPDGLFDNLKQGAKTFVRHLVRQRSIGDTAASMAGLARALAAGRDPYGCVPEIIAGEKRLGVRSSFQVAVGHRHPDDVNYSIGNDRTRDYLSAITKAGFDLCLHGSYRSTENPSWYAEEVQLLTDRLGRPSGSRQHFLSFDYDALFEVQERTGIRYDMSMGFPDRPGPRAGFSFPYFPYNLNEDRAYQVLEISLFLMDVTLQGYMGLRPDAANHTIAAALADLRRKRGCASAVWHPIVFGGARDPGYEGLYWSMIDLVRSTGGLAADGATIERYWRERARQYSSFSGF